MAEKEKWLVVRMVQERQPTSDGDDFVEFEVTSVEVVSEHDGQNQAESVAASLNGSGDGNWYYVQVELGCGRRDAVRWSTGRRLV